MILVSKALRSLPERFNVKISSIKEAHNTATMDLDYLMSILVTHEMNMNHQKSLYNTKDVSRNVAVNVGTSSSAVQKDDDDDDLEEIDDDTNLVFLTRKFNSMIRKINGRNFKSKEQGLDDTKSIYPSRASSSKKIVTESCYEPKDVDSIQCRACKGFGHYANECANTLRKYGKVMEVSMRDGEWEAKEKEGVVTMLGFLKENTTSIAGEVVEDKTPTKEVEVKNVKPLFNANTSTKQAKSKEPFVFQAPAIKRSPRWKERAWKGVVIKDVSDKRDVSQYVSTSSPTKEKNEESSAGKESADNVEENVLSTSGPTNSELNSQEEHESSKEIQGTERKDSSSRIRKNHPISQIIGRVEEGVKTRRKEPVNYKEMVGFW